MEKEKEVSMTAEGQGLPQYPLSGRRQGCLLLHVLRARIPSADMAPNLSAQTPSDCTRTQSI